MLLFKLYIVSTGSSEWGHESSKLQVLAAAGMSIFWIWLFNQKRKRAAALSDFLFSVSALALLHAGDVPCSERSCVGTGDATSSPCQPSQLPGNYF